MAEQVTSQSPQLTIIIIALLVIALAVFLEKKIKLPLGITCMAGSFLLGTFALDTPPQKLITIAFPSSVIMTLMLAMAFFGFFSANGTTKIVARKIDGMIKGNLRAAPWIFFIIGIAMFALLGLSSSLYVFMPLVFSTCIAGGMNPLMVITVAYIPAILGNFNPFIGIGAATRAGYLAELGLTNTSGMNLAMWIGALLLGLAVYVFMYIITKTFKIPNTSFSSKADEEIELNAVHKKSLIVLGGVVVAFVLPPVIKGIAPGAFANAVGEILCNFNVFLFGIVAVIVLKLGNWRDMLKSVSLPTFYMIIGVTFLIKTMGMAGLESVLGMIANTVPHWLIPPALILIVAFLSFFVSAATLTPITFPLAFSLAATPGQALTYLTCVFIGGAASGVSPISTLGAMSIGCVPEENQDIYSKKMFACAFIYPIVMAVVSATGVMQLLGNALASWVY